MTCLGCRGEFTPKRFKVGGKQAYCNKSCSQRHRRLLFPTKQRPHYGTKERDKYLRKTYGISLEDYQSILSVQGGVCAICKKTPSDNISLHVDHDHKTGFIRGLLCYQCNDGLGNFKDNKELLEKAIRYLHWPTYLKDHFSHLTTSEFLPLFKTAINLENGQEGPSEAKNSVKLGT